MSGASAVPRGHQEEFLHHPSCVCRHHVYVGADVARDRGKARGPMLNSTAAGLSPQVPSRAMPKKPLQWEVYRRIKGSPGAFIGIVEAPDETSALKTAIEEFGIINPEHQNRLLCGECWVTMIRLPTQDHCDLRSVRHPPVPCKCPALHTSNAIRLPGRGLP